MNNFATKSERKLSLLSIPFISIALGFLKTHEVYINAPTGRLCLAERGKGWKMPSWGTEWIMREQLSLTCTSIDDYYLVCHSLLIICHSFWTTLEANISMMPY